MNTIFRIPSSCVNYNTKQTNEEYFVANYITMANYITTEVLVLYLAFLHLLSARVSFPKTALKLARSM